jgi:hypothetical protein
MMGEHLDFDLLDELWLHLGLSELFFRDDFDS